MWSETRQKVTIAAWLCVTCHQSQLSWEPACHESQTSQQGGFRWIQIACKYQSKVKSHLIQLEWLQCWNHEGHRCIALQYWSQRPPPKLFKKIENWQMADFILGFRTVLSKLVFDILWKLRRRVPLHSSTRTRISQLAFLQPASSWEMMWCQVGGSVWRYPKC